MLAEFIGKNLRGLRVYIESYGCWLNRAESEVMKTLLLRSGAEVVDRVREADIIIVNTCAVREDTERRMIRRIAELYKASRIRGAKLIVAGCLARVRPAKIAKVAPKASLLGPDHLEKIQSIAIKKDRVVCLLENENQRTILPQFFGSIRYVVPIESGCVGNCAYCIGKVARPRLKSYDPKLIVNHIANAVAHGAKEIYLTGQDVASYGLDRGTNIVELLKDVLDYVEGDYIIRIGMMEPSLVLKFLDGLIEVYSDRRVYKYLHVPAQSFDDKVLELMGRKYTYEEFKYLVNTFRSKFPEITVATDIIVGFPGEDERSFLRTYERLSEILPDKVHVARYTIRPFTKAAYQKQVPEPIKSRRTTMLVKKVFRVTLLRNMNFLDKIVNVLITDESFKGDSFVGRLCNYKPVVIPKSQELSIGANMKVKIVGCTPIDLRGTLLNA